MAWKLVSSRRHTAEAAKKKKNRKKTWRFLTILFVILALVIGVVAFILLFSGSYKYIEKFLTALVVLMGVLFFVTAIAAKPDWIEVLKGIFCFKVPAQTATYSFTATLLPINFVHLFAAAGFFATIIIYHALSLSMILL